MSNNPIELLVMLGISQQESSKNLKQQLKNFEKHNLGNLEVALSLNKQSLANIQQHIKSIQSNIGDLDVGLNIKQNSSDTKVFENMNRQINALQSKIKELESDLLSVGKNNQTKSTTIFAGVHDEVVNTIGDLKQLESYLKGQGYSVKVDFDVDESGQKKVRHVLAQIKNELGEIETLKIKPTINSAGQSSFSLYGSSESDNNYRDFYKNQSKAYELLAKIERQGKLTTIQIDEYRKRIGDATGNSELEKELSLLKQLNQQRASGLKVGAGNIEFRNQTREAIANLEQLKNTANSINLDTSQYDKLINRMKTLSNIDIVNEEQVTKADRIFGKLSSQISSLKNNTASYSTAFNSLFSSLDKAGYQGLLAADEIDKIKYAVMGLNGQNFTLDEKLLKLKDIASSVNSQLTSISRENKLEEKTQRLRNEIDKLNAALTKTVNSYKRTVNMDMANSIESELGRLSRNMPAFTNLEDIKKYGLEIKRVENQIKSLNAEATRSARANMGVIEAFKVAMER